GPLRPDRLQSLPDVLELVLRELPALAAEIAHDLCTSLTDERGELALAGEGERVGDAIARATAPEAHRPDIEELQRRRVLPEHGAREIGSFELAARRDRPLESVVEDARPQPMLDLTHERRGVALGQRLHQHATRGCDVGAGAEHDLATQRARDLLA